MAGSKSQFLKINPSSGPRGSIYEYQRHQEKSWCLFYCIKSRSQIFGYQIMKGGDTHGSLMATVPETVNITEYGGSDGGCNIHHSNTGNQLYVPVVQRKR